MNRQGESSRNTFETRASRGKAGITRRIAALEAKLIKEPLVLYFADGTVRELPSAQFSRLFAAVMRGENIDPALAEPLELIRGCIGTREPNGAHLVELVQCILLARRNVKVRGSELKPAAEDPTAGTRDVELVATGGEAGAHGRNTTDNRR
jgi:hypothetical protein